MIKKLLESDNVREVLLELVTTDGLGITDLGRNFSGFFKIKGPFPLIAKQISGLIKLFKQLSEDEFLKDSQVQDLIRYINQIKGDTPLTSIEVYDFLVRLKIKEVM